MTDIAEENALRRKMRAARKACTDRATRDDCLSQRLMELSVYQKASCVLSYVSFGTEADTLRILERVLADGKALYVPKCVPNTNRMVFYRISALRDLSPGAYGILEPGADCPRVEPAEIDLIFVPGTAFDVRGHRIGQGGGYYDRYLNRTRAVRVGVCHDFALLSAVPSEAHDARMDIVVTPGRTVIIREETT